MIKGGLPPFKKYNKKLKKINKDKTFQPNLLISSLLKMNTDKLFKKNVTKDIITDTDTDTDNDNE